MRNHISHRIILALAVIGFANVSMGQLEQCQRDVCFEPDVYIEYKDGYWEKPGWTEFCQANPPILKHYMHYNVHSYYHTENHIHDSMYPSEYYQNGCANQLWQSGPLDSDYDYTYDATENIQLMRHDGAVQTHTFSGTKSENSVRADLRRYVADNCIQTYISTTNIFSDHLTNTLSTAGMEGVWTGSYYGGGGNCGHYVERDDAYPLQTGWIPQAAYSDPVNETNSAVGLFGNEQTACSSTSLNTVSDPAPEGGSAYSNQTLSDEYTNKDLEDKVRSLMDAMDWSELYRSSMRFLNETEENLYLRKIRVTFSFPTTLGSDYTLSWTEYTISFEGGVTAVNKSQRFGGTGGTITYQIIIEPPPFNGFTFVANARVCPSWFNPNPLFTIHGPGASSAGCCGAGSDGNSQEALTGLDGGPALSISLGQTDFGYSAGSVELRALLPNSVIASNSTLSVASPAASTEVITNANGTLAQAKSTQRLVHVSTVSSNQFVIHLFGPTSGPKVNGLYPTNGLTVLAYWIILAPDAPQTTHLQIIENKGTLRTNDFTYSIANLAWTASRPSGLLTERQSSSWDIDKTVLTQVYEKLNPTNGAVLYHEESIYERSNAIDDPQLRLTEKRVGTGANRLVTAYVWDAYTGRLTRETGPYGSWTQYEYGSNGKITATISGLKDVTYDDYSNDPYNTPIRKRESSYDSIDTGNDDGTTLTSLARVQTDYLAGVAVSQVKRVVHKDATSSAVDWVREYRMHSQDADNYDPLGLADPRNLLTETKYYTTGAFLGKTKSVKNPDGTMQLFSYSDNSGQRTTTVDAGQPNGTGTAVLAGTRNVTVVDSSGQITSSVTTDLPSNITTASITYDNFDSRSRPQRVHDNLSNLDQWTIYGCCMPEFTTNREGTVTSYVYDSLNRLLSSTTAGITSINNYNWAGNIYSVQRQGTNGSIITLASYAYDDAGRLLYETNALGTVTGYAENIANGYLVRTTTQAVGTADVGTRTERYFRDGQIAETGGTAGSPTRNDYGIYNDGGANVPFHLSIKLTAEGTTTGTNEWVRTLSDFFGRSYKAIYAKAAAPYPYGQSFYNNQGQLSKSVDPDGVATLYQYNAKGEVAYTATDLNTGDTLVDGNGNYPINFTLDRITWATNYVLYNTTYGVNVRRLQTYVWSTNSVNASNLVAMIETSTDGLRSWQTLYRDGSTPVVSQTRTVILGSGNRNVTNTAPDNSYVISAYANGRASSVTRYSNTGAQLGKTTYAYDAHGRQSTATDARNGGSIYAYNNADQVTSMTTPPPGTGQNAQTTTTVYNSLGRAKQIIQPDGTTITNEYHLGGLLKRTFGSRTYPVAYGYDAQDRMITMTNWTNFATGAGTRVTTWNYDAYRGWPNNKRYPDNNGPDYTYTDGGLMKTRKWARIGTGGQRILTTYDYGFDDSLSNNHHGDQTKITYSNDPQSTPSVTTVHDRLGRQKTITLGSTTTTLTYNDANQMLTEGYSGGTLSGFTVTSGYDTLLHRTSLSINTTPSTINYTYGYDYASRLTNVTDSTYSAGYSYLANSPLVSQITFKQNSTLRMTTTKQYDYLNRLQSISSIPTASGQLPLSFGYQYNDANQRMRVALNDSSFWVYQFDTLGQVTSGKKYWSDGTPVPGQQFEYGFDDVGNRVYSKSGGDQTGTGLRASSYTANSLNQFNSRTVPGAFDVVGIADAPATVSINGSGSGMYRRSQYFRKELSVSNSSAPVWQSISVTTSGGGSASGNVWTPKTPENYGFDLDGNQTSDGRWNYTWDAENRLIRLVANTGTGPQQRLDFEYDCQGRRIGKKVWNNTGGTGTPASYATFVYDEWNLVAELDGNNANSLKRSFIWGVDLSGSSQGAGGVAGLLAIKPSSGNTVFVAYDGNGNVAGSLDATTGAITGSLEYGPFGEALRVNPNANNQVALRFSTKYQDEESDLVYYGFRYYNPTVGRWQSRDVAQEQGGLNLYGFVNNAPLDSVDVLGQWGRKVHYLRTIEFSGVAGFGPTYAGIIGEADIGTDTHWPTSWCPLWGTEDRHLNYPSRHPPDSRDFWYDREFENAVERLHAGDLEQNRIRCVEAAQAFGRGLHSRQDRSAHRSWPGGGNWSDWIAHPGWWDSWDDADLTDIYGGILPKYPSEEFWRRWHQYHPDQTDYDTWRGDPRHPGRWATQSPEQFASQMLARQRVVTESVEAITQFIQAVRGTCFCRREMLRTP